ncbi:MAG: rhodanese-like domain-containing protein [Coriobacteriia bacterium]|nr:rhodanese-like domain-containing protein [Coriobacteriia bacterium]
MDLRKVLIWGGVAFVVIIGAVLLMRPAGGGVQDVSPARANELVAEGVRVIDVRTPGEYELSHIPGAENVPMDSLGSVASEWDRSEPLLIYCTTGARSAQAVTYLEAQGFETIYHLAAGIIAWDGDLERGSEIVPMPADVTPGAAPVMYEFSTDW